jgi:integrase
VSKQRKLTRRRDADPVRVGDDGRVSYWTGGAPGAGKRKQERCGSREAAEVRAAELRERLLRYRSGTVPKADATLDDLMRAARDHWTTVGHPTGTIRQYRSDWNAHVPGKIGATPCREVGIATYAAIFNGLNAERAPQHIIDAVARTLGAVINFGVLNGFFPDGQPFGGPDLRRATVKQARATAVRQNRGRKQTQIHLDECPTPADVDKYAAAFEGEYPGYGARMVWLAFGTGLRINEALALRWDSIDLITLDVAVDWQLDRYGTWPALALPKGNKERTTLLWECYRHVAVSLVEDALDREGPDHGWLFPRHRSKTKWADQAGKLAGAARKRCGWEWNSFHWLRHGYASWGLAPEADGGYGFNTARVQEWLGHAKPSTTTDTYVQKPRGDDSHVREATRRLPGRQTGE